MISDNASTYEAAADELKHLLNSEEGSWSSRHNVEIHSQKSAMAWRFLGEIDWTNKDCNEEDTQESPCKPWSTAVLQTIVIEVELILNDRPLTYFSDDIRDPEPLTPSHLLHGRRMNSLLHESVSVEDIQDAPYSEKTHLSKAVKDQSLLLSHFNTRWKREYLTSLREFCCTSVLNLAHQTSSM